MKKILLFLILTVGWVKAFGQPFDSSNSFSRIALVYYTQDGQGFFRKKENVNLDKVSDIKSIYGYNKKSHELYCIINQANCVVILNEAYSKIYKKSKAIPQLKESEVDEIIRLKNKELEDYYLSLNSARQKHIDDSIAKAKADSIKKAKADSIAHLKNLKQTEDYKRNHRWCWVPTGSNYIFCDECEKSITTNDSTLCYAIKNDSIYWVEVKRETFDIPYRLLHCAKIPDKLKKETKFQYHYNIYKDSLEERIPDIDKNYVSIKNYVNYSEYLDIIKKLAPHGYFVDWSWDNEYSISFSFRYCNTNKKTIKYIEVYWACTNDVGDVRKTGRFQGTGPLAEWESASWNWDHSSYYVSGDASKMHFTKVVITYMDGTKITIPKNKIMYE